MEKGLLLFVHLAISIWPLVTGSTCGAKKEHVMYAKIPDYQNLLSLEEFDTFDISENAGSIPRIANVYTPYTPVKINLGNTKKILKSDSQDFCIVDQRMAEMYFALERPPIFMPDMNYKSTITKLPASFKYMQSTSGISPVANSQCVRDNATLTPVYGFDKTLFFRGDGTSTAQAMWSSCPSRYIWNMRCENFLYGKRKCLLSESYFGVYIHGDMDDAPIDDIVQDLCRATGIRFGTGNFKWFFTFGENTLC